MEFKHIEYFIEATKHSSLSQAAEALYISQQALSRCIQNLETELGVRLFERTVKGSTLTDAGLYLLKAFSPVEEAYHSAEEAVFAHFGTQPREVTIASSPMIFSMLFPHVLYQFREKYPNYEFKVKDLSDRDVEEYVKQSPKNLGILAEPEHWHKERSTFTVVKTFPLFLIVHRENPLAMRESVSFGDLRDSRFMMLDSRSYYQEIVRRKAAEYGFKPVVGFESSDVHLLCSLVDNNKGVFIAVPVEAHTALFKNLVAVPFEDKDMTYSVAFVYQDLSRLEPQGRKFIEFMKSVS